MSDDAAKAAAARRADEVRALTEERAAFLARGMKDRAAQVDAELERLQGAPPKRRRAPKKSEG